MTAKRVATRSGPSSPLTTQQGTPYLEPHHIRRRADGPDHPRRVAAICPNCHREIHYRARSDDLNRTLSDRIASLEAAPAQGPDVRTHA